MPSFPTSPARPEPRLAPVDDVARARHPGFEKPEPCYIMPARQGASPMQHRRIGRSGFQWALAFTLAVLGMGLSHAAELERHVVRHRHVAYHAIVLPPERHVIEVTRPTYSGYFVINGTRFTATTARCARWAAGERIRLVAGDWHGVCSTAVFYNVRRRQTCEMWCP